MSDENTDQQKQAATDAVESSTSGEQSVEFTRFSSLNVQISVERPASHESQEIKPKIPTISRLGTPLARPVLHREKSQEVEDAKFNGTGKKDDSILSDTDPVSKSPDPKKSAESTSSAASTSGDSPSKSTAGDMTAAKFDMSKTPRVHLTKLSLDFGEEKSKSSQKTGEIGSKTNANERKSAENNENPPTAAANGTEQEEPLEPEPFLIPLDKDRKLPQVKNTFFGGVRYFTSNEEIVVPLSDNEESPFEPNKPKFFTIRAGRRRIWQDDTGERPYKMFGDIEDKITVDDLEPDPEEVRAAIETRNRIDRQYFRSGAFSDHFETVDDQTSEKGDQPAEAAVPAYSRGAPPRTSSYYRGRPRGPYRGAPVAAAQLGATRGARGPTPTLTMSARGGISSMGPATKAQRDFSRFTVQPEDFRRRRPRVKLDDMDALDDKRSMYSRQAPAQRNARSRYWPESGSEYSDEGGLEVGEEYAFEGDDDDQQGYYDSQRGQQRRPANLRPQPKQKRRRYDDDDEDYTPPAKPTPAPRGRQSQSSTYPGRGRGGQATPRQVLRPKPPALAAEETPQQKAEQQTVLLIKPYQQINRTIFVDMKFVLTSATRNKDAPFPEEDAPPMMPFVKRQVRQMIEERGGTVVEDFAQLTDLSNSYLIADQYYRTHKYLSALVRAVPCVSHMWIFECAKENRLLHPTIFMLPAGRTLETNQIIKWHDKCPTLLSGLKVYVHTENKPENKNTLDFVQIWTPIAKLMGATIINIMPDIEQYPAAKLDILLTDTTCPTSLVQKAQALGAKAVSSEWLIQGIIAGQLPVYDSHPKYRYDYVEPSMPQDSSGITTASSGSTSSAVSVPASPGTGLFIDAHHQAHPQAQPHPQRQQPMAHMHFGPAHHQSVQPRNVRPTTGVDYPRLEAQKPSVPKSQPGSTHLHGGRTQAPSASAALSTANQQASLLSMMTSPASSQSTVMSAAVQNTSSLMTSMASLLGQPESAALIYQGATLANQDASLLVPGDAGQTIVADDGTAAGAVILSQEEAIQLLLSQDQGATFATTEDGQSILIGQDEQGNPVIINQEDLVGATVIDADNLTEFQLEQLQAQLQQQPTQEETPAPVQEQPAAAPQEAIQAPEAHSQLPEQQQQPPRQSQTAEPSAEPQQQEPEQQQQQQEETQSQAAEDDPNAGIIMISPEDLQLLVQEGVQIISQDGLIIIKQEDGTETVVGSADGTQFQIITAPEGEELPAQEQL